MVTINNKEKAKYSTMNTENTYQNSEIKKKKNREIENYQLRF